LEKIEKSELIFTKYDNVILSAWVFVFHNEISIYYYWASTSDKQYRNLMAPYLMQWFAIEKVKKMWSQYYDFLWVANPWEINSPLAWVTDFKLKFTPDVRNVSESYMFINKKFLYFSFLILKKIKSRFF
jgi:lipid II:glycine glycyltransferase (peptidoglycan interpeptide bridge formation enzyme)